MQITYIKAYSIKTPAQYANNALLSTSNCQLYVTIVTDRYHYGTDDTNQL
jgi:hypothetical protein